MWREFFENSMYRVKNVNKASNIIGMVKEYFGKFSPKMLGWSIPNNNLRWKVVWSIPYAQKKMIELALLYDKE